MLDSQPYIFSDVLQVSSYQSLQEWEQEHNVCNL